MAAAAICCGAVGAAGGAVGGGAALAAALVVGVSDWAAAGLCVIPWGGCPPGWKTRARPTLWCSLANAAPSSAS
eukprot:1157526-Pyramimonas_sp.AAC.1